HPQRKGAETATALFLRMSRRGEGADQTHPRRVARSPCHADTHPYTPTHTHTGTQQVQHGARRPEGDHHEPTWHAPRTQSDPAAWYVEPPGCPPLPLHRFGRGARRPASPHRGDQLARKGDRRRSVAGRAARVDAGPRALLGDGLRLAPGG